MSALDETFTAALQRSPAKGGWTASRERIGKQAGDTVTVRLTERLDRPAP